MLYNIPVDLDSTLSIHQAQFIFEEFFNIRAANILSESTITYEIYTLLLGLFPRYRLIFKMLFQYYSIYKIAEAC